jgi:hypothetical protein
LRRDGQLSGNSWVCGAELGFGGIRGSNRHGIVILEYSGPYFLSSDFAPLKTTQSIIVIFAEPLLFWPWATF